MEQVKKLFDGRIARLNNDSEELRRKVNAMISAETEDNELSRLRNEISRRQSSYIQRERDYQVTIDRLKDEIKKLKSARSDWMEEDNRVKGIRRMHKAVMDNVETIQTRTAAILKEQEADLLRAFRARLFDTQSELEREKAKTSGDENSLFNRAKQLEKEVDWAKEMADRLDRANKSLTKENSRLKAQFKAQGDDRDFLVKQLVTVKRDNAKLKIALDNAKEEAESAKEKLEEETKKHKYRSSTPTLPNPGRVERAQTAPRKRGGPIVDEDRYKKIIKRLKKLLDAERKNLRQVRTAYANDMKTRTQLETLLRKAAEDVKRQISNKRSLGVLDTGESGRDGSLGDPRSMSSLSKDISVESFTSRNREKTLEILLSQERVLALLYKKTFPVKVGIYKASTPQGSVPFPDISTKEVEEIYRTRDESKQSLDEDDVN